MAAAMTPAERSAALTRVGPGTVMGGLMRQYWLPAALSSEVSADGPPLRLKLLGEQLLAFRDTSGRVGVMDHRCPHRGASMFYGRNEQGGLRCVYHGWKFDVTGACVDMPSVPPHLAPTRPIRARGYPAVERNGLIWVYMGARAAPPPLPFFAENITVKALMVQRECNWLQALEGDIDTSHLGFLHFGKMRAEDLPDNKLTRLALTDRAPEFEVAETAWGIMYGAFRAPDPETLYWRFANFLFPFWSLVPSDRFTGPYPGRAWVPMDDTHTMFVQLFEEMDQGALLDKTGKRMKGSRSDFDYLPNTTDWYGRWRLPANAGNDYMIDRAVQRASSYTGIDGVHLQDQAMTESMGPVIDHAWENLTASDLAVARTRRRLLDAALALAENGTVPPAVDDPGCFAGARSGDYLAPRATPFMDAYARNVARRGGAEPANAAE